MSSYKTILNTVNKNSLDLYDLAINDKLNKMHFYQAVFTKNKELLTKQIKEVSPRKIKKLKSIYTKESCLNEILYLCDNRYRHLKEIRGIVNIEEIVSTVITDQIYEAKVRIHYTDLLIDYLVENFYDRKSIKYFSKCRRYLMELDKKQNYKIMRNLDHYYIQRITK